MKKHFLAGLSAFLVSQSVFAGVLTLNGESQRIENVAIATDASATVEGRTSTLTLAGAGLRAKKVVFINVHVYVAQLLMNDPSRFVRTDAGALDSVDNESTLAMQLNFVRSVGSGDVKNAFRDSLVANQADPDSESVKAFLDAVSAGGDAANGKTLVIVGEKLTDGTEVVTFENNQGQATSIHGATGFVKQIFSIWLGKTTDSGLGSLKKAILGASN